VGLLSAALTAGALPAATPSTASVPEPRPETLSDAIADGRSAYDALPSGVVRRAPAPARGSLRTSTAPAPEAAPRPRGSLTSAPVSTIDVVYVQSGATWSDAAKAAFEAAVQVWERTLESSVPIVVEATACGPSSASPDCEGFSDPSVLGGAGPAEFLRNRKGTTTLADDVFEPVALANARTGRDLLANDPDIEAAFNPGLSGLYFGLDGNPGAEQIDFRTVVLHELGHGLGLVGTADISAGGVATVGDSESGTRTGTSFDLFTYATTAAQAGNGGKRILSMPDGSTELKTALTANQLYWAGQLARTAAGGNEVRLYAPSRFVQGTSYGHLDENTYPGEDPNGLMTPFIENGESINDPGQIAMGMLADMGYPVPALRGARYTAISPVRVLDTRAGIGAPAVRVPAGGVVDLQVSGRNGVPADATAVVLNVTGAGPSTATDIRVYPTPVVLSTVPEVSSLNLAAGITRANLVTVPVGNDGKVRLRNSAGSVSLLADLAGFYAETATSTFTAADPVRILDTRSALGTDRTTRVGPGEVVDLTVTGGSSPVPASATAVAMTVTAVSATTITDVRVYPTPAGAAEPPVVSNINVRPGAAVPNVVIVKIGDAGRVRLRNQSGGVHLLADVAGWYDASTNGALFRPVTPSRLLDTRTTTSPTVGPGEAVALRVGGRSQVPSLASAAVLNVTGVSASTSTDIRVYPATATSVPEVSNLNLAAGQTAADLVLVKLGNRSVQLRNSSGTVGLLVDVSGWFGPPS
jgi:hypothetical protein